MDATFEQQEETVFIHLGKRFDISSHSLFSVVCSLMRARREHRIVVDFRDTRALFDSGLGVLLMLHNLIKPAAHKIRLVNCSGSLRKRLDHANLPDTFSIA